MKILQKIICVDDEPDMRTIIKLSLENIGGYEVQEYSSGQELLNNLNQLNADLIILDAVMPGMDGLQTLAGLQGSEFLKGIPVLFMTGKAQDVQSELLAAGAAGVMAKPFDPLQLSAQVQKMWEAYHNGSDA